MTKIIREPYPRIIVSVLVDNSHVGGQNLAATAWFKLNAKSGRRKKDLSKKANCEDDEGQLRDNAESCDKKEVNVNNSKDQGGLLPSASCEVSTSSAGGENAESNSSSCDPSDITNDSGDARNSINFNKLHKFFSGGIKYSILIHKK